MTLLTLVISYLTNKWSNTLLQALLMAFGVALMVSLILFGHQVKERLLRDSAGIDVVVGAKGSPLQLILSTVQHIDIPTGNISLSEAERIKRHSHVKKAIPLSLGDSYRQFRIVGTEQEYLAHFNSEFDQGTVWKKSMQVVLGSSVAKETGLKVDSLFFGAHGLVPSGHYHEEHPYKVVGILKPTGTVLDRLIVTSLESVWEVHGEYMANGSHDAHEGYHEKSDKHHHHAGPHAEHKILSSIEEKEITALLVKYKNRTAVLSFPRMVHNKTSMQAASPAFEIAHLVELIGVGTDTMFMFGALLIAIAFISVLVGLLQNIRDRKYDLAIFRALGASRWKVMTIIVMEGMIITFIASLIGIIIGHVCIELMGMTIKGAEIGLKGFIFLLPVWVIWGCLLIISFVVCLIPAWEAYKTDIRSALTYA